MAQLAVKTYAKALFEVANEIDKMEQFQTELFFVVETFKKHPDFHRLYGTPRLSLEEKKGIIDNIFSERLTKEIVSFLKILLDKGRTGIFEEITREYQRIFNQYNNIIEGLVITAVKLNTKDKAKLEQKLTNITGKTIKLHNKVDPSIIGGMLVRVGDKVIDGTVESRLSELKEMFAQIIV
jgi:F-type H+-transporting ATPase subunit delta